MKKTLCLLTALVAFPFLPPASAAEESYPEKDPVITYVVPEKWTAEAAKDGGISINSADGRISVNFATLPVEASMAVFEKILPHLVKELTDPTVVVKPTEHTEFGLTGYAATYTGKIENRPVMCIMTLFKGGKEHAVVGNVIVESPETLSTENSEALGKFMQSVKGAAK